MDSFSGSYDDSFRKIENLMFYPWVGADYRHAALKILFVGESHYGTSRELAPADRTMKTRLVLEECLSGVCIPSFFQEMTKVFFAGDFSRWKQVAFFNYIQASMESVKEHPSAPLLHAAWEPFEAVLAVLAPDIVICASTKVYRALRTPAAGTWELCDPLYTNPLVRHAVYHSAKQVKTLDIVFYAIWHPSRWRFARASCREQLKGVFEKIPGDALSEAFAKEERSRVPSCENFISHI